MTGILKFGLEWPHADCAADGRRRPARSTHSGDPAAGNLLVVDAEHGNVRDDGF